MFPHTQHVECITDLRLNNPSEPELHESQTKPPCQNRAVGFNCSATVLMSDNNNPLNSFAATRLPWVVAAGRWCFTRHFHSWISFASLPAVSHVGGWHDLPQTKQPLLYLVTLPLKLLPASALPFAMNGLAAVFGALILHCWCAQSPFSPRPHEGTASKEQSEHSLWASA